MKYMALKKQTFWMFVFFAVVISVEYVAVIINNFAADYKIQILVCGVQAAVLLFPFYGCQ